MRLATALLAMLAVSAPLAAQAVPAEVTAADYARAERFLSASTSSLVYGDEVRPRWLSDGRFWYPVSRPGGTEYMLVDPVQRTRGRVFDHDAVAGALANVSGRAIGSLDLDLLAADLDRALALFQAGDGRFVCHLTQLVCQASPEAAESVDRSGVLSPDGRWTAFIRDHDLWVREGESGAERRLTTDGEEDFGYATDNAGWVRSARPVLSWSPDSRKIATFQHDARGVGMMYAVGTDVGHPDLDAWRYPLPEDSVIFRISRVVIDLDRSPGTELVRLNMPPDQHRSTCSDHVVCGGTFGDVEWSPDGSRLAFVSTSRDHKRAQVRIADTATGEVRDLFEEVEETHYLSGNWNGRANWRFLSSSDEILWFSQRDDWGHLYLYDARTGALKRQVTAGEWNVAEIVRVDEEERALWVMGNGREPGDPYFRYLYRVGLDGGGVTLLTPDSADHTVSLSPTGEYIVDAHSTPVRPPVTVLRDGGGAAVMTLEEADIAALLASGWRPPMPFTVKARDGATDLHGLLFRPTEFDEERRYPVVNYLYPGPQRGSVGSRSFAASRRDLQAIAELGFVVVELDALGTPGRSKSFHDAYYGNLGDNGLPDQIAGIRQLAERYRWMDLDRVGIFGHSGGGYAAAAGILRYPDFYHVAVSQAGNHENRNYEDDWGERWQGLLIESPDGTTSYDNQSNHLLAENLVGKLLIAHGGVDTNVPVSNTLLLVEALIEANKDFDLVLLPNSNHGFGDEPYMMRRRWDYFVRHLLGTEPPAGYEIGRLGRPIG